MSKYNPRDVCELCQKEIGPNQKVVVIQRGRTEIAENSWTERSIESNQYWINVARNVGEKNERLARKQKEIEDYEKWKQGKVKLMLNGGAHSKKLMHDECYESLLALHDANIPAPEI